MQQSVRILYWNGSLFLLTTFYKDKNSFLFELLVSVEFDVYGNYRKESEGRGLDSEFRCRVWLYRYLRNENVLFSLQIFLKELVYILPMT